MQTNTVMAFRKRMKKRGYTYISIYKSKKLKYMYSPEYKVSAREPLANTLITTVIHINDMNEMFRF